MTADDYAVHLQSLRKIRATRTASILCLLHLGWTFFLPTDWHCSWEDFFKKKKKSRHRAQPTGSTLDIYLITLTSVYILLSYLPNIHTYQTVHGYRKICPVQVFTFLLTFPLPGYSSNQRISNIALVMWTLSADQRRKQQTGAESEFIYLGIYYIYSNGV